MHIFRPLPKHLQSSERIGIKLFSSCGYKVLTTLGGRKCESAEVWYGMPNTMFPRFSSKRLWTKNCFAKMYRPCFFLNSSKSLKIGSLTMWLNSETGHEARTMIMYNLTMYVTIIYKNKKDTLCKYIFDKI